MRRLAAIAIAALVTVTAVPAAQSADSIVVDRHGGDPLIVPIASGLHYKSTDKDGTSKFDGKVLLSGTYYYEAGDDPDSTSLEIALDRATMKRLPHYKDHGAPDTVFLDNAAGFAAALNLPKGTKKSRGKTQIWADHFETGIECDVANYSARFVSLAKPAQKVAAADLEEEGC
jgi:hypothetical protein